MSMKGSLNEDIDDLMFPHKLGTSENDDGDEIENFISHNRKNERLSSSKRIQSGNLEHS